MSDFVLNPKAPGEVVRYPLDFSHIDPDTIATATLTRTAGTITLSSSFDSGKVYATVTGGVNGESASFTCTITTTLGQTFIKTVDLKISTTADVLGPDSAITKGAIVIRALGKINIANYVFDAEAEELTSALRQLDSLASNWQAKLSQLPYTQPSANGLSLNTDSAGIDEADVDAWVYNLAEVLAGDYGKSPAPGVLKRSAETRSDLFIKYQVQLSYAMPSRQPTGAGNDRWLRRRFFCGS